jgi:quinol-cytochrome oxidoreductase complex cytochrome b subunit
VVRVSQAYESVQFIVTKVQFGWLIRNIHSWSANLLIAAAFAHFFSVFLLKSYRKPRELTWATGVLLLFLMLGFGFSGYLLPWNELSFFATKVGTGIAGAVPIAGPFMLRLLRGGDDVTGATLSRFYGLHVAVLPAITTALVALHLLFVQRQGMSVPIETERRLKAGERLRQMPFFRTTSCATSSRGTSCWPSSRRWPRSIRGILTRRRIRSFPCRRASGRSGTFWRRFTR